MQSPAKSPSRPSAPFVPLLAAVIGLAAARPVSAQDAPAAPKGPLAATLGLTEHLAWRDDGAEFYDHAGDKPKAKTPRGELLDAACAQAKSEHKLVCWYVPRILEKTLGGRQMYRAPVLDVYVQQVLLADPDVAELLTHAFVPVRCAVDQKLSDRFHIAPLDAIEPAFVFLDGDGKVVHLLQRVRTFNAQWFLELCARLLERQQIELPAADAAAMRQCGRWRAALTALAGQAEKEPATWLEIAHLQRLLHLPEQARDSVQKATAALDRGGPQLGDALCELGLLQLMGGDTLAAMPSLEQASRAGGKRAQEAAYWYALALLRTGNESLAMRKFTVLAQSPKDSLWVRRARANTLLGPDDRPFGAAFAGFESVAWLPEPSANKLPTDTAHAGDAMPPRALAEAGVRFLLAQQRNDGGFTDSRYAYWPSTEITPNVWVAITAIAATALNEFRDVLPERRAAIDAAVARAEAYAFDPAHLNRGANEDCYSDAYRLLYLARRARTAAPEARESWKTRMDRLVAEAAQRQAQNGFWGHEYENAFASGAVLQTLLAARSSGATVPTEVTDKGASALISARFQNGTFVYGGKAQGDQPTPLKDASGRMPVCEGALLQLGRSNLDKVRFALDNFWQHMDHLEKVRRNDFHSDGELGGFFFFHSVFHASETVLLLPEAERAAHWQKFVALLQKIPEIDGSFLDSHELGRSYGTAMALLTLRNAATLP